MRGLRKEHVVVSNNANLLMNSISCLKKHYSHRVIGIPSPEIEKEPCEEGLESVKGKRVLDAEKCDSHQPFNTRRKCNDRREKTFNYLSTIFIALIT